MPRNAIGGNEYVSTPLSSVGPLAAFHPKAPETSSRTRSTSEALIVPLIVIAFCQPETGPSVTGWVWTCEPAVGAAQPGCVARNSCEAWLKASSLNTGFDMVRRLYRRAVVQVPAITERRHTVLT